MTRTEANARRREIYWLKSPEERRKPYDYSRDKVKSRHLKELYGISLEEYRQLFNKQEGKCAICKRMTKRSLDVDHDHLTGKVRGLLCSPCNRALGMFQTSTEVLYSAIKYLGLE